LLQQWPLKLLLLNVLLLLLALLLVVLLALMLPEVKPMPEQLLRQQPLHPRQLQL
jgi:hypothetical protein